MRDGALRPLTDFAKRLREHAPPRPIVELTPSAPDGQQLHGFLVTPEGEGPHPVLLMIHGGPFAQYGWTVFDEAQVYAGAGYAVVYSEPARLVGVRRRVRAAHQTAMSATGRCPT